AGSLALVPVGLGVVELTMMHSHTSSGLAIPQAAAALIIYRLFQLWLPMVAGLIGLVGLRRRTPPPETPALVLMLEGPTVVAPADTDLADRDATSPSHRVPTGASANVP